MKKNIKQNLMFSFAEVFSILNFTVFIWIYLKTKNIILAFVILIILFSLAFALCRSYNSWETKKKNQDDDSIESDYICPICGCKLIKGKDITRELLECTNYPDCLFAKDK